MTLILQAFLLICANLSLAHASSSFILGKYTISISEESLNPKISIFSDEKGVQQNVFETIEANPYIQIGEAELPRPPVLNGNFQAEEVATKLTDQQTLESKVYDDRNKIVTLKGYLMNKQNSSPKISYTVTFSVSEVDNYDKLSFSLETSLSDSLESNRIYLKYQSLDSERFYGMGESLTYLNLKGRRVPLIVTEGGVGRGLQPITDLLNKETPGVGGDWYTTYSPRPVYVTNLNRSVCLDGSAIMYFDFTSETDVEIEVWATNKVNGWIFGGSSMASVVQRITSITGRQAIDLPEWSQKGAIVGLEGGSYNVSSTVDILNFYNVPLAGVWLQDWVGLRHNPIDGDRLIWNWEVNYDYYPDWHKMVEKWQIRGTKVLTYINPLFSDPTNFVDSSTMRHNFFKEGIDNGYFIKNATGDTYMLQSISIQFAMVDLTNPAAWDWLKNIIIEQSIQEGQSSGWMCDFGEYVPFDAVLYSGESPFIHHNKYPQLWAQLTKEAIDEAQSKRKENDILFFMRASWTKSSFYTPSYWVGDQLQSWDSQDGLKSVVTGSLSSGLSGFPITHSDIGGYTAELEGLRSDGKCPEAKGDPNAETICFVRTPELLKRWSELAAFGAALYRTHIGSSTSEYVAQIYDSTESIHHFAAFAKVFGNLSDYRRELFHEAAETGLPLMRPLFLYYSYDNNVWDLQEQYLFGEDILVAPVMTEGAKSASVYFPSNSGEWNHIWSKKVVVGDGQWVDVPAPVGFPPVFYKTSSIHGQRLKSFLVENNRTMDIHSA